MHSAAGGIATPADAALLMQLGSDGAFVGSGCWIGKPEDQLRRAKAIVQAVAHHDNPQKLAEISTGLGPAMVGLTISDDMLGGRLSGRGY